MYTEDQQPTNGPIEMDNSIWQDDQNQMPYTAGGGESAQKQAHDNSTYNQFTRDMDLNANDYNQNNSSYYNYEVP
jgi:hypothetical protein